MRPFLILASIGVSAALCFVWLLFQGLDQPFSSGAEQRILLDLRLPLVLTAVIVGSALSVSAALLQVSLRNPLADPGIIGISSGASVFAAVFLLAGSDWLVSHWHYGLPAFCFIGALLSSVLIFALAKRLGGPMGHSVILAGIALSTLGGAVVAWLYFYADAQSMRHLTFWLMGSLHQADWALLSICMPVMAVLVVYMVCQGKRLNLMYFSTDASKTLGLNVERLQWQILLGSALLVGLAVSLAGSIAFVGLLVPHLLRLCFGHDNRLILPAAAIGGALLMLLVLVVSQGFGGVAVPVSMLTATLGGPLFLLVLYRHRGLS